MLVGGRRLGTVDVNTAALRVGRLVEMRPVLLRSEEDVLEYGKLVRNAFATAPPSVQVVCVTDLRYCPVMSEGAATLALTAMTQYNPRVLRSGVLASRGAPVAMLQFLRLVRGSKHESRRVFFAEDALTGWLGEVLTEVEATRLDAFLSEPFCDSARRSQRV